MVQMLFFLAGDLQLPAAGDEGQVAGKRPVDDGQIEGQRRVAKQMIGCYQIIVQTGGIEVAECRVRGGTQLSLSTVKDGLVKGAVQHAMAGDDAGAACSPHGHRARTIGPQQAFVQRIAARVGEAASETGHV